MTRYWRWLNHHSRVNQKCYAHNVGA